MPSVKCCTSDLPLMAANNEKWRENELITPVYELSEEKNDTQAQEKVKPTDWDNMMSTMRGDMENALVDILIHESQAYLWPFLLKLLTARKKNNKKPYANIRLLENKSHNVDIKQFLVGWSIVETIGAYDHLMRLNPIGMCLVRQAQNLMKQNMAKERIKQAQEQQRMIWQNTIRKIVRESGCTKAAREQGNVGEIAASFEAQVLDMLRDRCDMTGRWSAKRIIKECGYKIRELLYSLNEDPSAAESGFNGRSPADIASRNWRKKKP